MPESLEVSLSTHGALPGRLIRQARSFWIRTSVLVMRIRYSHL